MEIENMIATIIIEASEIKRAQELSQKIEAFGPMHLTMILVDSLPDFGGGWKRPPPF